MSALSREDVSRRAADLLAGSNVRGAPVPVEQLAIAHGIQIVRSAAEWSESGFLLRDNGRVIIGINSRNSPKRQRFTISHELGHWLMHDGKPLIVDQSVMINKRDDISSQATDWQEIQANQFAAELLMPKEFVMDELRRQMTPDIGSREELITVLARAFDVSNDAMGWRLINLGVLSS
jgi:Zn-dependent peptidase ImmA (M78 family)